MTRKDYKLIAEAIAEGVDISQDYNDPGARLGAKQSLIDLSDDLCIRLKHDNPAFDSVRFLRACHILP